MPIVNRITEFAEDMKTWRRDIHRHPELSFEEQRTADLVAEKLAGWGIEVHRRLAGTGVVGLLKGQGDLTGYMVDLATCAKRSHLGFIRLRVADFDPFSNLGQACQKIVRDVFVQIKPRTGHTTLP